MAKIHYYTITDPDLYGTISGRCLCIGTEEKTNISYMPAQYSNCAKDPSIRLGQYLDTECIGINTFKHVLVENTK